MELNELDDLIRLLRAYGVQYFEDKDVKISLSPPSETPISSPQPIIKAEPLKSMWHHNSLWPGGKPPEFPK